MVVPPTGGTPRPVFTPQNGEPFVGYGIWAPDGRTLYFKVHLAGRASLWSISLVGGRPRPLVRFDDPAFQSARNDFSTDGKNFYFAVEDRQSDVFVADLIRR
jgi:Tol biopolymer transport system component